MNEYNNLQNEQLLEYAVTFSKLKFTEYGFYVYEKKFSNELLITKKDNNYIKIKVVFCKGDRYISFSKNDLCISKFTYIMLCSFEESESVKMYLIPSTEWNSPNTLFIEHSYDARRIHPDWGLRIAKDTIKMLRKYEFSLQINSLTILGEK